MHSIVLAGITGLALLYDPSGTAGHLATALSVRGLTWVVKKITENIDSGSSQLIDFAGWSIAGVSIVKIISNAMGSMGTVNVFFINVATAATKVAEVIDKITFWN